MQDLGRVVLSEVQLMSGTGIYKQYADIVEWEIGCAMEATAENVNGVMERDSMFSKMDFELGEHIMAGKWLAQTLKEISCAKIKRQNRLASLLRH